MSGNQLIDVDEADALVLEENLEKLRSNCLIINKGLNIISIKSNQSELKIKPLINETNKLNLYKSNIDNILSIVNEVKDYSSIIANYEQLLINPNNLNKLGTAKFIKKLKDCDLLYEQLNQSDKFIKFKGLMNSLVSSIKLGELNLKTYFELSLNKNSKSFDPQKLISSNKPFPFLSNNAIQDYKLILNYFQEKNQPINNILTDNRSKLIVDSMAILEPFTKNSAIDNKKFYTKSSNGIINYSEALICFITNENSLIQEIYGNDNIENFKILNKIFEISIENYEKVIKNLTNLVESNKVRLGMLIFEVVESLEMILKNINVENKIFYNQLSNLLEQTRLFAQTILTEYILYVDRRYSELQLSPNESTVCDTTIDLTNKLIDLASYRNQLLFIIRDLRTGSWIPTDNTKPEWFASFTSIRGTKATQLDHKDPKNILSSYISDSLDGILIGLEVKAKSSIKKSAIGFYLLLNFLKVKTIVENSILKKLLLNIGYERLGKIEKRFLGIFLDNWKKIASYLMDITVINSSTAGSNNLSKEKETIKEKFKKFNDEFEELVKTHKSFNMKNDPDLKNYIYKEITFISPLYLRFYNKYGTGDYFKHTEKYVRFTPKEFDETLKSI
ncbi:hypothetical protein PACTADRAFT_41438 [Pachysolen tannophilus NRRL Y-2460]|uniref:Exocyst complex protein EXO70 n=1 Tax=Pachysolen tannophilus NRRL Y-2460 TaxID=669874 RepID=A0A1E4TVX5_PACTA|nr:hypothetical protein PACTADRAFT_41438 [Pachysolen tannophilus NRRL Y-2460]